MNWAGLRTKLLTSTLLLFALLLSTHVSATPGPFCYYGGDVSYREGERLYQLRDYPNAMSCYINAGQHSKALYALGWMYEHGEGIAANYNTAMSYYKRAGQHPQAVREIGWLYQRGYGVRTDNYSAMSYYKQAVALGDAAAASLLAQFYEDGKYVPMNYGEALRYNRLAADRNDVYGMQKLAYFYGQGLGTPINAQTSRYWAQRCVTQARKDSDAQVEQTCSWYIRKIDEALAGGGTYQSRQPVCHTVREAIPTPNGGCCREITHEVCD